MSPLINAGPLALDEHGSYWIIDSDLPGSSLERSLNYAAIPPLSSWLQQASLAVFGKNEFAFRLPSALCALMTAFVIYRLGTELRGPVCGGVAALMIVWHPEAMDEVRIARCYGLVLLMSSILLLATLRWLRSLKSFRLATLWGLAGTALLWTHYTAALLVIICAAFIGWTGITLKQQARAVSGRLLLGFGLAVVLNLPLIPAVLRLREWGPFLNYTPSDQSLWSLVGPFWWAGLPVGCIACLVAGGRKTHSTSSARRDLLLVSVCSLLPLIFLSALASSGEMSSLTNPRYRVAYAPASVCLAALILTSLRNTRGAVIGAIALLGVSWLYSPLPPWQLGRLGHSSDQDWYLLNRYVATHTEEGEPIFVQGGLTESNLVPVYAEDLLFMEYVACRVSRFYVETKHPRYALPSTWTSLPGTTNVFRKLIASWTDPATTFWVASCTDTDLNKYSLAGIRQIAFQMGFEPVDKQEWPTAVLIRYARTKKIPSPNNRGSQ